MAWASDLHGGVCAETDGYRRGFSDRVTPAGVVVEQSDVLDRLRSFKAGAARWSARGRPSLMLKVLGERGSVIVT